MPLGPNQGGVALLSSDFLLKRHNMEITLD